MLVQEALTDERITEIVRAVADRAQKGDVRAAQLAFEWRYGPAGRRRRSGPEPEPRKWQRLDLRRLNDAESDEFARLMALAMVEEGEDPVE